MNNQTIQLNIGDEIGFVTLGTTADDADKVIFFPVAEITRRDGQRAYRYMYPDGEISSAAIRESELSSHVVKIRQTTIETNRPVADRMLNLSERRTEFVEALNRGKNSNLVIFNDFEKDAFAVVNRDNRAEYQVHLKTVGGNLHADCDCPDFIYRKRVCKHIGGVLVDALFAAHV